VLFDNAKSVVTARDAFGEGEHRWNRKRRIQLPIQRRRRFHKP
jgi:hypothetical protein